MTGGSARHAGLLSRPFWVMMGLAMLSFVAAAVVVTLGPRLLPPKAPATVATTPAVSAPLARAARGAKRASPDPSGSRGPP